MDGTGPTSNQATGTPSGEIGTPVPTAVPGNALTNVNWPVPEDGGHTLSGYSVFYRPVGETTWKSAGNVTKTSIEITGLTNGTEYEIGVTAHATDGSFSQLGTTTVQLKDQAVEGGPTPTPTPTVTPTPQTVLKVKARAKAKKLKPSKKTKVVRSVATNGEIKKIRVKCYLYGKQLKGRDKRVNCKIKTRIKAKNAIVKVTPNCSVGLTVKIKITAQAPGEKRAIWNRTWKVKNTPRTICTLGGNG